MLLTKFWLFGHYHQLTALDAMMRQKPMSSLFMFNVYGLESHGVGRQRGWWVDVRHGHCWRNARMTWRWQRRQWGRSRHWWPLEGIARSTREKHVSNESFDRSFSDKPDKEELFDDSRWNSPKRWKSQEKSSKPCWLVGIVSSTIFLQSALWLFLELLDRLCFGQTTGIWKNREQE